jgi:hypothetical protein
MAKYSTDFQRTSSTTLSVGVLTADSTRPRRAKVYDVILGSEAAPADAALLFTLRRCTAAGTSTGVTPQPLDPADAVTEFDAGENHTVEPTYTANAILLNIPLNQRATFRWAAAPGGELVTPATAANGVGIESDVISTGTPVVTATVHFDEQ